MEPFEPYEPEAAVDRAPIGHAVIEPGSDDWLTRVARLSWERNGGEFQDHLESVRRKFAECPDQGQLFLAKVGEQLVGFAWAAELELGGLPRGWYLSGIVVAPGSRRRGIGLALTRIRLEFIRERAHMSYYFASAQNLASIDLHTRVGFREIRRHIRVEGCHFTGGVGILFARES
ncbi:MAG: GNAT family N-acetyltransferase [Planctomycetota bacterium]|nr:GNAT family N-acetyltransferase [Planctomycetota bacterium]